VEAGRPLLLEALLKRVQPGLRARRAEERVLLLLMLLLLLLLKAAFAMLLLLLLLRLRRADGRRRQGWQVLCVEHWREMHKQVLLRARRGGEQARVPGASEDRRVEGRRRERGRRVVERGQERGDPGRVVVLVELLVRMVNGKVDVVRRRFVASAQATRSEVVVVVVADAAADAVAVRCRRPYPRTVVTVVAATAVGTDVRAAGESGAAEAVEPVGRVECHRPWGADAGVANDSFESDEGEMPAGLEPVGKAGLEPIELADASDDGVAPSPPGPPPPGPFEPPPLAPSAASRRAIGSCGWSARCKLPPPSAPPLGGFDEPAPAAAAAAAAAAAVNDDDKGS
jgi:hypothetical protein